LAFACYLAITLTIALAIALAIALTSISRPLPCRSTQPPGL